MADCSPCIDTPEERAEFFSLAYSFLRGGSKSRYVRVQPRPRQVDYDLVERIIDNWVHTHAKKVRSLREKNPDMKRAEAELEAAYEMEPLFRRDRSGLLIFLMPDNDHLEVSVAVRILSRYFVSFTDIGGPTRGKTAGGGRRVIRKWDEFS